MHKVRRVRSRACKTLLSIARSQQARHPCAIRGRDRDRRAYDRRRARRRWARSQAPIRNDGGKGNRAAVKTTFGKAALIHRCRLHKVGTSSTTWPKNSAPSSATSSTALGARATPTTPSPSCARWPAKLVGDGPPWRGVVIHCDRTWPITGPSARALASDQVVPSWAINSKSGAVFNVTRPT